MEMEKEVDDYQMQRNRSRKYTNKIGWRAPLWIIRKTTKSIDS